MKTREEVAKYINSGELARSIYGDTPKNVWFDRPFGKLDLRALMDFIYEGEPKNDNETIDNLH